MSIAPMNATAIVEFRRELTECCWRAEVELALSRKDILVVLHQKEGEYISTVQLEDHEEE